MYFRIIKWFKSNIYLSGIVLLALGLLLYHVADRTFWMDETAVLEYFKFTVGQFLHAYWIRPDNHPPLYYLLVLLVSKVLPWSELTVRLVSILSGVGIVIVVYLFTLRLTAQRATALLASFFTAFSSYFVLIDQMARYHALAAFFALLALYFFYQLFFDKFSRRAWLGYLAAYTIVGYVDYPHFIYIALFTNAYFLYRFIRHSSNIKIAHWIAGQAAVAVLCLPLLWMLYHRIFIQGDGGWSNVNLLGNSWLHLGAGMLFHLYVFFFGENIFPWNYAVFGIGAVVLLAFVGAIARALYQKRLQAPARFLLVLGIALVVLNTLFMNVADRRYNFIVYPKFGFVAYPIWIMLLVIGLRLYARVRWQQILFALWGVVALVGLYNFYQRTNYLNASYFSTFDSFNFVRSQSQPGDYLALTPDAGEGTYIFYKQKYFTNLTPLTWSNFQSSTVPVNSRVWLFATASDAPSASVATNAVVPPGYAIIDEFDSVPLDLALKKYKELVLHRPSYTYKYSVFLLKKI